MATLDVCLNYVFEPGFIPASSGLPPVRPALFYVLTMDMSDFRNTFFLFL